MQLVSIPLLPTISQHRTQVLLRHSFFKEAYVQLVAKLHVVYSEKPLQEVCSGSCFAERALALFLVYEAFCLVETSTFALPIKKMVTAAITTGIRASINVWVIEIDMALTILSKTNPGILDRSPA